MRTGRPEKYPRRQMLDACIYVLRSGCSWRMLPKDFPPWMAVYQTFRRWLAQGRFETLYDELRKLTIVHHPKRLTRNDSGPTLAVARSVTSGQNIRSSIQATHRNPQGNRPWKRKNKGRTTPSWPAART
jgi:transposase